MELLVITGLQLVAGTTNCADRDSESPYLGHSLWGCPACRDPDAVNRYCTGIFRFQSASLTAETALTCLQKQRIYLEEMRTYAFL